MEYIVRWGIGIFISALILLGGFILLISKPRRNNTFGYVGRLSLENDNNWNYANKILSFVMIGFGMVLVILTIVLNLVKVDIKIFMPVLMGTLAICLFFMVWLPGLLLKKHILECEDKNKGGNENGI